MASKPRSRILEAVHTTARDLHRLGFIDKCKMHRYDALCLASVQNYDAKGAPYRACGPVTLIEAEGDRPMSITGAAGGVAGAVVQGVLCAAGWFRESCVLRGV